MCLESFFCKLGSIETFDGDYFMGEESVFLAEAENHVRQAVRLNLELIEGITITGEAKNAEDLLAQICPHPPDVLILDWKLPGMNPQRLLPVIRKYCPRTLILGTLVRSDQKDLVLLYELDGYLIKDGPPENFLAELKKKIRDARKNSSQDSI
jgi:DNA-binding NarL/FixJ family response regulator